ncbi:hypothetical protein NAL19_1717 [Pectobacterium sp. F1-1]|nr:hypothetical protein NAL19_1717 [Pectobacterium sp. F1-1]
MACASAFARCQCRHISLRQHDCVGVFFIEIIFIFHGISRYFSNKSRRCFF